MLSAIWRTSRGLRVQLSLALAAVAVGTALLATVYSNMQLARVARDSVQSQLLAIARSFGDDFEARDLRRPRELQLRLRRLIQLHPGVTEAAVYASGARGRSVQVVSSTERSSDGASRPLVTGAPEYVEGRPDGLHVGTLTFPLRDRNRPVAVLRVSLDMATVDRELAEQRWAGIVLALLEAVVLTVAMGMLLSRRILRPLRHVERATRLIREGHFQTRLGWRRRDELGALARNFDAMAGRLQESQEQLEALAFEDPLTGLPNLRAFEDRLRVELQRAGRESYPISILALDLDSFKALNDSRGHAVGDEALRLLAHTIMSELRPSDICGRVGGDEFAVALPRTSGELAGDIAARLSAGLELVSVGPEDDRVTFSGGIVEFPLHATDQAELMRMADGAMYAAKADGRDRVALYQGNGVEYREL